MKPTTFYVIILATAVSLSFGATPPASAQLNAIASNPAPEDAPNGPASTVAAQNLPQSTPTEPTHQAQGDSSRATEGGTRQSEHTGEPDVSAADHLRGAIAATLNSAAVAGQIRNATRETRDELFTRVEMAMENSGRSLRQLREQGRALKRESRDHYNAAVSEVRLRERALRESLKSARRATAEQASAAQARLAADYEAYAVAVAATESAVDGSSLHGQLTR